MKTANWKNESISLLTWPKEAFARIHEAGKNGELQCNHCGQPVYMYLGIHEEPYFIHRDSSRPPCVDKTEKTNPAVNEASVEYGGFRLPQSRSITNCSDETIWQGPKSITSLPSYNEKHLPGVNSNHPFIDILSAHGWLLDDQQANAVVTDARHLLVLAGAGSGKTRVLTARTAFLLLEKQTDPKSVMLVTFTSKAAAEMKSRLQQMPGVTPFMLQHVFTGTFHSIFYRILLQHEPQKWHSSKLIKFDGEKEYVLKIAASELGIDEREFAFDQALQQISRWKNDLLSPQDIHPADDWEVNCQELYKKYESYKEINNKFDFDDMQTGCYQLLKENEQILNFYRNRFKHFLIDEFQDINKVQYEIVRLLASNAESACFVGDDDQAIYSFRGSDSAFLQNLKLDYDYLETIILSANYRSGHKIIQTANKIVSQNKTRTPKKMVATHDQSPSPVLFYPFDEESEAIMIMTDITEKIRHGANPEDFAILYRTNTMSRAIFEKLASSSLPFRVDSDYDSFYTRKTVRSILAFMKASINPDDPGMLQDLLPPLYLKKSAVQDAKALSILNDCTLLEALRFLNNLKPFQMRAIDKAVSVIHSLKDLSPSTAIEMIEKELGFGAYLKKRGNEGNKMDKGSDDIKDVKIAARRFDTVLEFILHADHMTAMSKEIKSMSKKTINAIQLSTIHRSKGLEYKYVYILGCVDGNMPHDYALESWRDGDRKPMEEERRLLYVAVTRACSGLYISIPENRRSKRARSSRFLTILKGEPSYKEELITK
ncbi:ATP-dependent helicase [Pradoshia sp. D12]|nr:MULTISPECIES: ATP-dependent helicase [unclassified Bacillus (in: firmicutes)]OCA89937.1 ATP-dependent DNA helicase Rep [Bacillus sp. FJAT-27986]QFK70658.1 ATP-dependent helicase [Pradoshia sp. D12]TPF72453.1 ATP-dependent helicase [Bacillus sp. D12]